MKNVHKDIFVIIEFFVKFCLINLRLYKEETSKLDKSKVVPHKIEKPVSPKILKAPNPSAIAAIGIAYKVRVNNSICLFV